MAMGLSIIVASLFLLNQSAFGFHSPLLQSVSVARTHHSTATLHLSPESQAASENNHADADDATILSRRRLFGRAISSTAAATSLALTNGPSIASAKVVATPFAGGISPEQSSPEREALLEAITNKSSNEVIAGLVEKLLPLSPLKGDVSSAATYESALDGEWKLIWYSTSGFSPLLKLPSPFRPDSYQYFGSIAEKEVGPGRVAQGLVGGILSGLGPQTELWLSSGAVAQESHPSTLEIYPPFRFQLGVTPGGATTKEKRMIVEADSDAEFRKVNARTTEAQLAPKNEYEQMYVENFGRGSLRVSVVTKGDPVIVGEMFVHQKL
mmetsp:Transcript_12862/g.22105  ORF Transcript_12862/g.22105 Transcript_12862/m.22105 type:complete len:325 (+) Transcript_12862:27-1001(+)